VKELKNVVIKEVVSKQNNEENEFQVIIHVLKMLKVLCTK